MTITNSSKIAFEFTNAFIHQLCHVCFELFSFSQKYRHFNESQSISEEDAPDIKLFKRNMSKLLLILEDLRGDEPSLSLRRIISVAVFREWKIKTTFCENKKKWRFYEWLGSDKPVTGRLVTSHLDSKIDEAIYDFQKIINSSLEQRMNSFMVFKMKWL